MLQNRLISFRYSDWSEQLLDKSTKE